MADGLPVERLRQYLRELKPEARVLLTGELERGLLRGEGTPGAELVLQELRRSARESVRPSHRSGSLARLFFQPLEPFLVDDIAAHNHPGRIARVALEPIWEWICCDLLPGEAKAVSEEVGRAFVSDDIGKAEQITRGFQDRALLRMQEALAAGAVGDDTPHQLPANVAAPRALADVRRVFSILRAREALESLGLRLPSHVKNLSGKQLDELVALFESRLVEPQMFLNGLLLAMSRLGAAWQLIRLAIRAAGSDIAAHIAETRYAVAVDIVLAEIERMGHELKSELRGGQGIAVAALLKTIHDATRGVGTEINLSADSRWGRQLAHLRSDISDLLQSEIESMPGRVRRLLRPRADNEIGPRSILNRGDVGETETLIEFAAACRDYSSEFAVSEITQYAFSEVQQYLAGIAPMLIDGLRRATETDRAFRRSQFDAALRFCARVFGQDYASTLAGAGLIGSEGERNAAKA
jgi:hypothetical protein